MATYNRIAFLKIVLDKLTDQLLPDEEIIVVDGNSNDGTKVYLEFLHQTKKIHQYVSEADKNQAHAWNKGFLLAKGKIIKKIMDDDVFDFVSIRKCKDWMLTKPEIGICISNTLQTHLLNNNQITITGRLNQFLDWKAAKTNCFTFSDVYMLIRKDILSITGLYDTQFCMIDWEFALRCSYSKINIAYYTGYNSLTVHTPGNVTSLTTQQILRNEAQIAKIKYGYPGDRAEISIWSEIKIFIGKNLDRLKKNTSLTSSKGDHNLLNEEELSSIYNQLYKVLAIENQKNNFSFLC